MITTFGHVLYPCWLIAQKKKKKKSCKLKVRLESNVRLVAFKQIKDQLNDFYYYYYFLTLELKYLSEKKGRGSLNKKKKKEDMYFVENYV
jgi:hypothetical protein